MLVRIPNIDEVKRQVREKYDCDIPIREYIEYRGMDNILGKINRVIYEDYVEFCKSKGSSPIPLIDFSKRICRLANIKMYSMRVDGKVCRVAVSKDASQ